MEPDAPDGGLMAVLSRLQDMYLAQPVAPEAAQQLAEITRTLVPHASVASVSVLDPDGTAISTAATGPLAEAADAAQFDLGDGPALSAWATRSLQHLRDAAGDTRWPVFSRAMVDRGVRSALAAPMVAGGEVLGTVKVYAAAAGAFTAADEEVLGLLATAAAALLAGGQHPRERPRLSTALHATLRERHALDLATGVLMERHRLGPGQAGRLLEETAAAQHQPPGELAREILRQAESPGG